MERKFGGNMGRSTFVNKLKKHLQINGQKTAVVTVDMNRGCLDPRVATIAVPAAERRRVLENSTRFLSLARNHRIPVIHTLVVRRPVEIPSTPFHGAVMALNVPLAQGGKADMARHNLEGTLQTQLMPELYAEGDYIINNKKRMGAFYGTDLENLLRTLQVDTIALFGINTNTCVLCTAFEAYNRGFKVVMISDCVGSWYGQDLHRFALENVSRCMGWVLTVDEFEKKLRGPWKSASLPKAKRPGRP